MRTRRWRLWFGVLKLTHREHLDFDERRGVWPSLRIGNRYFIWKSYSAIAAAAADVKPPPMRRPTGQDKPA